MVRTDYTKVEALFLVYPENFEREYHELAPFFEELISLCPNDITFFIICNNQNSANHIKKRFKEKDIRPILVPDFYEVWLRDVLGFAFNNKIIKPQFNPSYCNQQYSKEYLNLINEQVDYIIKKSINIPIERIDVNWDGGNFSSNERYAFVTNKVIEDSPDVDVAKLVKDKFNLKLILLPLNKYDPLGHTDVFFQFISPNEVLLSKVPNLKSFEYDSEYLEVLKEVFNQYGINVTHMYDRPIVKSVQGAGDARGSYTNFLNINGHIIMPEYKIPNYKKELDNNLVNAQIFQKIAKSVQTIESDELAKLGGVLHCVSWVY